MAPPPAPPANQAPAPSFAAPATAVAGSAVLFDARATTDPDGDALSFSWDFGNGVRGGGERIGHVFDRAGSFVVRLTVSDGRGGVAQAERSVTVAAPPAPAGFVDSTVRVRSSSGQALQGVTVALVDGSATTSTGADGQATLRTGTGVPVVLRLSKVGYADQVQRVQVPASAEPGFLQVTMRERAAAVTLPDAGAGGTVDGPDGVRVVFAPGSLVDAAGNPASGAVQVAMTPVDVTETPRAFPGRFEGLAPDGEEGLILSFGVVEVVLQQGGQPLQLAPGRRATLEIPVYARLGRDGQPLQPGDTYPLWSLNERTGLWVAEGTGTVVAAPGTPEGLALRGEVAHFSWWNHDLFAGPPYRPRPKCLVDTNYDGVLEDLSGTGYCWHEAGTPTNWEPRMQQQGAFPGGDRRHALAARIANTAPTTPPRPPAFIATAATPAGGGAELPIPADMDIIFHSYARNGTLFGQTLVRGTAGVSEDVVMVLSPVADATGTVPITLPWGRVYAMGHVGEVDRFSLVATAGQTLELLVSRSNNSTLSADIVVRAPDGSAVGSGAMGASPRTIVVTNAVAGTYTVEVRASGSAPGAYRLQARALVGTCGTGTPLSLPLQDETVPLPVQGLLCLDVTLGAGQALDFETTGASGGLRGAAQLRSPQGEVVAQDSFVTNGRAALLRAGVVQPGTYRIEVVNTGTTGGNVRLRGALETLPEMGLPDTFTRTAFASGAGARVLLRTPAPGGEFALSFNGCNGSYSVTVFPSRTNFQSTGGTCGGLAFFRAMSYQEHPAVLPVLQVFRNVTTSQEPGEITLRSLATTPLALDADVTVTALPRGQGPGVYTFTGASGQALSWGQELPANAPNFPTVLFYGPDGVVLPAGLGSVWSLAASGRHTVVVLSENQFSGDFTLRLNNAAPPADLTLLDGITTLSGTLALGEVRRWRFPLDNAEVFALGLSTPTMAGLSAVAGTSQGGFANVTASSGTPLSARSAPAYAAGAAVRELRLSTTVADAGRAQGDFTLQVIRPLPLPAQPGQVITGTLGLRELRAWRLDLPGPGYHLLRTVFPNNNGEPFRGVVWGPTAPFINYDGDLRAASSEGASEAIALLRAGAHTLTLDRTDAPPFAIPGGAQAAFSAVLVPLPAPEGITLGAAAQARALQIPGERRYHRFDAAQGQSYTATVQPGFNGTVRVYKQAGNGNHTSVGTNLLPGLPVTLVANQAAVASFTIPGTLPSGAVFGSGVYIIEVDAAADAVGSYTVQITTP
ncbi:MAG: PKD domain-containing protein [Rubrivivax sp.]|nr:PKD domain-containing protein [Rubrivivax sp.]